MMDKEWDWRMKSRDTQLEMGHQNTKFFHNFANHRKRINTIWEMPINEGRKVRTFQGLAEIGVAHFEQLYRDIEKVNIVKILKVVSYFTRLVQEEDNVRLYGQVTKEELLAVLNSFYKDKSPSLDRWTKELFIRFFDLFGDDLSRVVEKIKLSDRVPRNFNSTFIALIPRVDFPNTINGFRPITLCNCIYR